MHSFVSVVPYVFAFVALLYALKQLLNVAEKDFRDEITTSNTSHCSKCGHRIINGIGCPLENCPVFYPKSSEDE